MSDFLFFILAPLALMSVILAIAWPLTASLCHSSFKDTPYTVRYKFMAGCQVKTAEGWIPVENFVVNKETK